MSIFSMVLVIEAGVEVVSWGSWEYDRKIKPANIIGKSGIYNSQEFTPKLSLLKVSALNADAKCTQSIPKADSLTIDGWEGR